MALEAKRMGHGGVTQMSQVTGMHQDTIRRGRKELEDSLAAEANRYASPRPRASVQIQLDGSKSYSSRLDIQ